MVAVFRSPWQLGVPFIIKNYLKKRLYEVLLTEKTSAMSDPK